MDGTGRDGTGQQWHGRKKKSYGAYANTVDEQQQVDVVDNSRIDTNVKKDIKHDIC